MDPGLAWSLCAHGVHTYRSVRSRGRHGPACSESAPERNACYLPFLLALIFECQTLHHAMCSVIRNLMVNLVCPTHFTDGQTKVQREEVIYLRSHPQLKESRTGIVFPAFWAGFLCAPAHSFCMDVSTPSLGCPQPGLPRCILAPSLSVCPACL